MAKGSRGGKGRYQGNATAGSLLRPIGGREYGVDLNVADWNSQAGKKAVNASVTLEEAEQRIKNMDHEQLVVVDKYGYVESVVDGGEHSVQMTVKSMKAITEGGATVTHNHPNGGTFSPQDVITACQFEASEVRAVSKRFNATWSLKAGHKANGRGLARAMEKDTKKIEKKWDSKIQEINKRTYANQRNYERAVYEAYNSVMSMWLRDNADKYGYTYSKTYHNNRRK